jgi:site-specific recombinase XerD
MATIKVLLNKSRSCKDGRYPLVVQVIHCRRKKLLYLPYHFYEENFDEKSGKVLSPNHRRVPDHQKINTLIQKVKADLQFAVELLERRGSPFSVTDIFECYLQNKDSERIVGYVQGLILQLEAEGRHGTVNAYKSTLSKIISFVGQDANPGFEEMDTDWVSRFAQFLQASGIKVNTIAFYLRVLHAINNRAFKEGVSGAQGASPFRRIHIPTAKTDRLVLDKSTITQIARAHVDDSDSQLALARDLFLFSYYSRGMLFVDMAFLKYSDIRNGAIYYIPVKTKQLIRIRITPQLHDLMEKYRNDGEYVLPILNLGTKSLYAQYRSALKQQNRHLKELTEVLHLPCKLTTYVARHSWASIAKQSGVPISVISEGLGHSCEKITQTYLADMDPSGIDAANDYVTNLLPS